MLDDRSPIYQQIAERIRDEVLTGSLATDDPVMSTNQFAEFYGINPATAAKAFHQLIDEGVLYQRRGVGMFVAEGARERLSGDRRSRYVDEVLDPAIDRALVLGIPLDELAAHLTARAALHDTPRGVDHQNGATP